MYSKDQQRDNVEKSPPLPPQQKSMLHTFGGDKMSSLHSAKICQAQGQQELSQMSK